MGLLGAPSRRARRWKPLAWRNRHTVPSNVIVQYSPSRTKRYAGRGESPSCRGCRGCMRGMDLTCPVVLRQARWAPSPCQIERLRLLTGREPTPRMATRKRTLFGARSRPLLSRRDNRRHVVTHPTGASVDRVPHAGDAAGEEARNTETASHCDGRCHASQADRQSRRGSLKEFYFESGGDSRMGGHYASMAWHWGGCLLPFRPQAGATGEHRPNHMSDNRTGSYFSALSCLGPIIRTIESRPRTVPMNSFAFWQLKRNQVRRRETCI
jgi:hypothetical protein